MRTEVGGLRQAWLGETVQLVPGAKAEQVVGQGLACTGLARHLRRERSQQGIGGQTRSVLSLLLLLLLKLQLLLQALQLLLLLLLLLVSLCRPHAFQLLQEVAAQLGICLQCRSQWLSWQPHRRHMRRSGIYNQNSRLNAV